VHRLLDHPVILAFCCCHIAGVIPLSFLLAHFGSELMANATDRIRIAVILLGMLTMVPLIIKLAIKSLLNEIDTALPYNDAA